MAWDQEKFDEALDKGNSYAWEQEWDEAIKSYREALEEFPDNPAALTSLGLAFTEKGDLESALQCYQHAAQVNPDDAVAISSLARMYEKLDHLEEAAQSFTKAAELYLKNHVNEKAIENYDSVIHLQPGNLNARIRLSIIYDEMNMKVEAVDGYLSAASLLQKNGDEEKALQIVNRALTIQPESQEAIRALQLLQEHNPIPLPPQHRKQTDSVAKARVQLSTKEIISELEEKDPIAEAQHIALVKLAGILFERDEDVSISGQVSRKGASNLSRGTGGIPTDHSAKSRLQLHLGKAIDFQTQGDDPQAALELEKALEIGGDEPAAYFELGLLCAHTDTEKAMKYLTKSLRQPEFSLGSYLLIAGIYKESGQLDEAAKDYLHALALADTTTVPSDQADELNQFYDPIFASLENETDEGKLINLCNSIQSQLIRKDWRANLNSIRQQMGGSQEGVDLQPIATMLMEMKGSRVIDAMTEIRKLEQQGYIRSAMEVAFHAIPYSPVYLPLHAKIADLLVKEGRLQAAVEKFNTTSDLYHVSGETPQAINLLRRASKSIPMDLAIRQKLIELLNSQGRIEEVLNEYMELARIYYQLAELDMARKTCLTGVKLAQEAPNGRAWVIKFMNRIADIDVQRLDWRNAIKVYTQLNSLQPEEPSTRMKLIDLNLRLGQKSSAVSEADGYITQLNKKGQKDLPVGFMKEIVKEHPDILEFQKRLVELLINEKRIPDAIKELDSAAKALTDSGDKASAIQTLKLILQLNPPNSQEYQNAIDELV
jgi:tetratricopeptide (TPR) repeat protein